MWGMAGWSGSDDAESLASLQLAVDMGCNFFDTAWAYGDGHSERLLGELIRHNPGRELFVATKVPPKNRRWPSRRDDALTDVFPSDHIREYTEKSLENLGLDSIHLLQFHVWEDEWADDERWLSEVNELKSEGLIHGIGISLNRWEPWNGIRTVQTGAVDAVQVIYNVFDQSPEDELFPACREHGVAVIARVPFDEGSLTGALRRDSTFAPNEFRSVYFNADNLGATMDRVKALEKMVPDGMSMAELALRFILSNDDVSVVIPGMRKRKNVRQNMQSGEKGSLPDELLRQLREFRWDRVPTEWSR
jgi:aryl-alcohol dehydrogenase-like predicted oxidoreductase